MTPASSHSTIGIEHESSVDYSKAEPVDHEEEGFRIRIENVGCA